MIAERFLPETVDSLKTARRLLQPVLDDAPLLHVFTHTRKNYTNSNIAVYFQ